MTKQRKIILAALLAAVAVFVVASIAFAATASARRVTAGDKEIGEVLLGDEVVMRFHATSDGRSPVERADAAAARLNDALKRDSSWQQFTVQTSASGNGVYAGNQLIAAVLPGDAKAVKIDVADLAYNWRDNVVYALGGTPAERAGVKFVSDGNIRGGYYSNWEGAKTKWVPILDVNNNGIRIGAAQVAGPEVQVDKVKAVAQLGLSFQRVARIKVYIPTSSLNVIKLDRVQGVSVWATGDLRIVRF